MFAKYTQILDASLVKLINKIIQKINKAMINKTIQKINTLSYD